MKIRIPLALILFVLARPSRAQDAPPAQPDAPLSFEAAAATVQLQLAESLAELDALRQRMAEDKLPLSRALAELEGELSRVRLEYQDTTRLLDGRTLDLGNLKTEIKTRQDESTYLSNLLGEYVRGFESRLHIAELQRHGQALEAARLAPENSNLTAEQVYQAQAALLGLSLDRLEDALGGVRFAGTAVDQGGLVENGTFFLVGPAALFRPDDGGTSGTAEQRLGSLEPAKITFVRSEDTLAAEQLLASGVGLFPLDPTLGNAHKIAATEETLVEHIKRGGPVMIPILIMAALALLVALYKWLRLAFLRSPSPKRVELLLEAVAQHDEEAARHLAGTIKGPAGRMLTAGVEHLQEPRELIEEVMYETVLTTRLKLQSMLPFIAVCASSAPLLGLLGTVTGIINTFKMITVFGSGDVKSLSGGISEALITTEYGLIVAIPALLLHAFLARKARSVTDQMEKTAIAFVNQVSRTASHAQPLSAEGGGAGKATLDPELVKRQVSEILGELLGPLVEDGHGDVGARKQVVPSR